MSKKYEDQIIELLRAESEGARSEVEALRASLRYRLGDLLLQVLPLSWRSLYILPRLLMFYRTYKRNRMKVESNKLYEAASQISIDLKCSCLIFAQSVAETEWDRGACRTDDSAVVQARLDAGPLSRLVLGKVDEQIVRRLGRLKLQGCEIIWCPEAPETDSAIEHYVRALADECRYGDAA